MVKHPQIPTEPNDSAVHRTATADNNKIVFLYYTRSMVLALVFSVGGLPGSDPG